MSACVTVIGFGNFGKLLCSILQPHIQVEVFDPQYSTTEIAKHGYIGVDNLHHALTHQYIILAIPVPFLEDFLKEYGQYISAQSTVLDVCSVKMYPVELMKKYLPTATQIVATHPLFGPVSAATGITGLKCITYPVRIHFQEYTQLIEFLDKTLKLTVMEITPEDHDRDMAYVQALTFLIGKGLDALNMPQTELTTPTFEHLKYLHQVVSSDTPGLFATIQQFNPFAQKVRQKFVQHVSEIDAGIKPCT